jgi:hypothetical protein
VVGLIAANAFGGRILGSARDSSIGAGVQRGSAIADRFNDLELKRRAMVDGARSLESERTARQEFEKREFEVKFRQLVDALSGFSSKYNDGKGLIWPHSEAEKLVKAMRALQDGLRERSVRSKGPRSHKTEN